MAKDALEAHAREELGLTDVSFHRDLCRRLLFSVQ